MSGTTGRKWIAVVILLLVPPGVALLCFETTIYLTGLAGGGPVIFAIQLAGPFVSPAVATLIAELLQRLLLPIRRWWLKVSYLTAMALTAFVVALARFAQLSTWS